MFAAPFVDKRDIDVKPVNAIQSEFALSFTRLFNGEYIVSHHAIKKGRLLSGKPIEPIAAIEAITSVFSNDNRGGWNNNQVIYETEQLLAWHRKPSRKEEKIWFRYGQSVVDINVKLPSLVFILNKMTRRLHLFATLGGKMPKQNTKLYHAPICNVDSAGIVCIGTATMPKMTETTDVIIEICEAAIVDTLFTHPNHTATFKSDQPVDTKKHIELWKEIAKTNKSPNANHLNYTKKTLAQVISSLERKL